MLTLKKIFYTSRPRFWLYLAGPFLVGYVAGMSQVTQLATAQFWIYFLYFLFPANVFLYGINDLADSDTDQYNDKKKNYEHPVRVEERSQLKKVMLLCICLSMVLCFFTLNGVLSLLLLLLLFFSYAYSMSPWRWKAKPFIDSSSNILYIIPGVFGFFLTTGKFPALPILGAAGLWSAGMHLFSAIPDIDADRRAGLLTTAVFFGKEKSLIICILLWFSAWVSIMNYSHNLWCVPLLVYAIIPLLTLIKKWEVMRVYKIFPALNGCVGFGLFWFITIQRFFS